MAKRVPPQKAKTPKTVTVETVAEEEEGFALDATLRTMISDEAQKEVEKLGKKNADEFIEHANHWVVTKLQTGDLTLLAKCCKVLSLDPDKNDAILKHALQKSNEWASTIPSEQKKTKFWKEPEQGKPYKDKCDMQRKLNALIRRHDSAEHQAVRDNISWGNIIATEAWKTYWGTWRKKGDLAIIVGDFLYSKAAWSTYLFEESKTIIERNMKFGLAFLKDRKIVQPGQFATVTQDEANDFVVAQTQATGATAIEPKPGQSFPAFKLLALCNIADPAMIFMASDVRQYKSTHGPRAAAFFHTASENLCKTMGITYVKSASTDKEDPGMRTFRQAFQLYKFNIRQYKRIAGGQSGGANTHFKLD